MPNLSVIIPAGRSAEKLALALVDIDYLLQKLGRRSAEFIVVGGGEEVVRIVKNFKKFIPEIYVCEREDVFRRVRGKHVIVLDYPTLENKKLSLGHLHLIMPFFKDKMEVAMVTYKTKPFLFKLLDKVTKFLVWLLRFGKTLEAPVGARVVYVSGKVFSDFPNLSPFGIAIFGQLHGLNVQTVTSEEKGTGPAFEDYLKAWVELVKLKIKNVKG